MPHNEAVEHTLQSLIDQGAVLTDPHFSVAGTGQADVVMGGSRLLITPNDEAYSQYAHVMEAAGLPYVADGLHANPEVVVGQLPRDARTFPSVVRSRQPEGFNAVSVLTVAGRSLRQMADNTKVVPAASDLSIGRTVVLRSAESVLWLPPMQFVKPQANQKRPY